MPGSSSWMPYAPQGVKVFDVDDDDHEFSQTYTTTGNVIVSELVTKKNIY